MKRLLIALSILSVAACFSEKSKTADTDTAIQADTSHNCDSAQTTAGCDSVK